MKGRLGGTPRPNNSAAHAAKMAALPVSAAKMAAFHTGGSQFTATEKAAPHMESRRLGGERAVPAAG